MFLIKCHDLLDGGISTFGANPHKFNLKINLYTEKVQTIELCWSAATR